MTGLPKDRAMIAVPLVSIAAVGDDLVGSVTHHELSEMVDLRIPSLVGIHVVHGPHDSVSKAAGKAQVLSEVVIPPHARFQILCLVEMMEPIDVHCATVCPSLLQVWFLE